MHSSFFNVIYLGGMTNASLYLNTCLVCYRIGTAYGSIVADRHRANHPCCSYDTLMKDRYCFGENNVSARQRQDHSLCNVLRKGGIKR